MTYLYQRIIQNHFQWTRPSPGRRGPAGEGEYVQEHGFGHEDWNFNRNLLIDGSLYGYCYYNPTQKRRDERFSIAFATYANRQWYLIGFYLDSEFVENPPTSPRVLHRKMYDLRQLGSSLDPSFQRMTDERFLARLEDEAQYLKWRVSPDNAIRTLEPIAIPKRLFDTKNYHITTPTEITKSIFDSLYSLAREHTTDEDYGSDEEFSEGREFERRHKLRERNQAAVTAAKNSFREKHGKLFCQVCGFDFLDRYGELGRDFIEAHHTIPVSTFKGQVKTKLSDIALVCANCHRMLHKRRPWLEMKDLERLIENRDDVPGDA